MDNISFFLIPDWVNKKAIQKKLDYMDMLDYNKLRPLMSTEDMIDLCSLTNIFETEVSNLFTSYVRFNDSANTPEFSSVIKPSLYSQDAIARNRTRLTLSELDMLNVENNDVYTVKVISEKVIILFIKPGFVNLLSGRNGLLELLKSLMAALYTVTPIYMAAQSPVYSLYLKTLFK